MKLLPLLFTRLILTLIAIVSAVMEEVVLIEQPQSGHVIKTRPYRLSCKALNARKIRFKCNSNWLDETRYESTLGTDPNTQLPYMLGSVEITKQEVEVGAHSEVFTCQCYASGASDLHVIRSDPARIRIAYMRKHFVQSPTSDRVPEGSTVQLHCVAPESDPKAKLTWIKDGIEVEKNVDSNIIYANDGSLIISAARLSDSGNYTCEATNIANRRTTEPAALGVYVNGGWSSWSPWSGACDVDCTALRNVLEKGIGTEMIPKLRRVRMCNNPAPLNGGVYCFGEEEEFRSCNLTCRLDGRWSKWSEWSSCSPTCHRFRRRTCTSPPPTNAGRPCAGRDLETVTCSEDYCIPSTIPRSSITNDATIYGGLACVFVLLAVIMVLCTALLCKRNKGKRSNMKNIYYAEPAAHMHRVLLEQQQKAFLCNSAEPPPTHSQFFTLTSTCSPSPMHPSMTLRSGKSVYSGYSTNRNAGSRAALITDCSSNSSSGCGKRTLVHTSSNYSEEENYATLYDYFDEKTVGCLETSQAILAAQVDHCGARLQLRKCGVALLIPENAVDTDRMIYVAVSDEVVNRPQLQSGESVLSSIIVLGECEGESASPPRLLLKPVVLSFRHCASVFPRDNWSFVLYADEGFGWQRVLTVGEENLNSSMYVHMENPGRSGAGMGWCHVMLESFARVMLAGRPRRQSVTVCKRVHLAAYGPAEPPQSSNFELRIYCVPETGAAMESVAKQEQHGRLLAESEHFMLNEKGDLCFCVEDVSEGFSIKGSAVVEISETHHQWCSQNGLHCSMTVCADAGSPLQEFLARIVVYQKTNNAERHVLHIHLGNNIYDKPAHEEDRTVTVDFHLPLEIKDGLSQMLDPPTNPERDWRGLAKKASYGQIHSVLCNSSRMFAYSLVARFVGSKGKRITASCARLVANIASDGSLRCSTLDGRVFVTFLVQQLI